MPRTAPNTKEAQDKLNELWQSARRYYDDSDWRVKQVEKLAKQLLKSDPIAGWAILSGVSALTGDVKSTYERIDNALRLSTQPSVFLSKAGTLANLGYFSEGGRAFRQALSVDVLPWRLISEKATATGSILAFDEALKRAGNMPTAVPDDIRKTTVLAASILRQNNVSDEDVGGWMDRAGEILREHRLFYVGDVLFFATMEEEFGQVDLSFLVDVDSEQATKFNLDLVKRCARAGIIPPECFSFGFRSSPALNERIAA
jgi:hypothetical protein